MRTLSLSLFSFITLLLFSFLGTSCDPTEIKPEICKNGTCNFEVQTGSAIEIVEDSIITNVEIVSGNSLVFQYEYEADDNRKIADDEYLERIYFRIHSDAGSFTASNEELIGLSPVFYRACFCPEPFYYRITKGTISGTRQDNLDWKVEVDVEIDLDGTTITRSFSKTFKFE